MAKLSTVGAALILSACAVGAPENFGSAAAQVSQPAQWEGNSLRYCKLYVPQPISECIEVETCQVLVTSESCDDPYVLTENHWACCPSACAWGWSTWAAAGCSSKGNRGILEQAVNESRTIRSL